MFYCVANSFFNESLVRSDDWKYFFFGYANILEQYCTLY